MLPHCQPSGPLTSKFSVTSSSTSSASVNSARSIPTISIWLNKLTTMAYDTKKTTRLSFCPETLWILWESSSILGRLWVKQPSSCRNVPVREANGRAGSSYSGRDSGVSSVLEVLVFSGIHILNSDMVSIRICNSTHRTLYRLHLAITDRC